MSAVSIEMVHSYKQTAPTDGSISKKSKKRTKSRNGCLTCKKKRLKCGEEKPFCLNCIRKNIVCGGYAKNFKWRDFNDSRDKKQQPKPVESEAEPNTDVHSCQDHIHTHTQPPSESTESDIAVKIAQVIATNAANADNSSHTASMFEPNSVHKSERSASPNKEVIRERSALQAALEAATVSVTGMTTQEVTIANALIASGKNPEMASTIASALCNATDRAEAQQLAKQNSSNGSNSPDHQKNSIMQEESTMVVTKSIDGSPSEPMPTADMSPASPFSVPSPGSAFSYRQAPLTPDLASFNSLQDVLNSSRNGDQMDSPKFLSLLTGNRTAMGQFQNLLNSPGLGPVIGPLLKTETNSPSPIAGIEQTDLAVSPTMSQMMNGLDTTPRSDPRSGTPKSSVSFADELIRIPQSFDIDMNKIKLLSAFDRYTCGIMSMRNGPTENPWRTFMIPLSKEYPVMFNAIGAMTCFHVARGDTKLRDRGLRHMKNAIVALVDGLSCKTTPPDVALGASLALTMGEVWNRQVSSGMAHLKGARAMIMQVLNNIEHGHAARNYVGGVSMGSSESLSRTSSVSSTSSTSTCVIVSNRKIPRELQFLFNAWMYFDVIARMTDDGHDSDDDSDATLQTKEGSDDVIAKYRACDLSDGDEVDPLLGVGQSLFPIIGQVATLITKIRKQGRQRRNTLSDISRAVDLKRQLESWSPPLVKNLQTQDPLFDASSAVATAEAYRYAALLYLHQAVPEVPSLSSHSLAENIMMLLASIPQRSRTCVTHIFPLLVASCEATPGDERDWILKKWEMLSDKMWIGNVDRALEVVKEVWKRKEQIQKDPAVSRSPSKDSASEGEEEFYKVSRRISECINGPEVGNIADEGIWSWTHWGTVMKDWGWNILLG